MPDTPSHATIAAALAAAQGEMSNAAKDSRNPAFKSKYADLASVREACLPALSRHGIAVIQPLESAETGDMAVRTVLLHADGERIDCAVPLILGKRDMQGLGSAITYARRYGLMMMAGIAPDDDDGNAAAATVRENPMGAAVGDAWKASVLDRLPEGATPRQKAEAFAGQIVADLKSKKGMRALDNEWSRRKRMVEEFQARYPDLCADVLAAYDDKRNEMLDNDPEARAADPNRSKAAADQEDGTTDPERWR